METQPTISVTRLVRLIVNQAPETNKIVNGDYFIDLGGGAPFISIESFLRPVHLKRCTISLARIKDVKASRVKLQGTTFYFPKRNESGDPHRIAHGETLKSKKNGDKANTPDLVSAKYYIESALLPW